MPISIPPHKSQGNENTNCIPARDKPGVPPGKKYLKYRKRGVHQKSDFSFQKKRNNLLTARDGHGIIQKLSAREAHGSAVSEEWAPGFELRGKKKGVDKKKAARYNKRHGEMPNGP